MKRYPFASALLLVVFCISTKGQIPENNLTTENIYVKAPNGPRTITRDIKQDKKGNIWLATWEGVFRYDGKGFTNMTNGVSSARFFSVLEDRKGNLWFGTIGSGVYKYNDHLSLTGQTGFQNFTIKQGLLNNEITSMYEDRAGNIWFGVNGGVSRYDGKFLPNGPAGFRNFIISRDSVFEDRTGKWLPEVRPPNEVNSIIEDKTGKLWFATRSSTFAYDRNIFTVFKTNEGKSFTNVRCIIEDKKGNIWLGGDDGLWRYDGRTFTNFTSDFIGYIHEDKKGNIWISSDHKNANFGMSLKKKWTLSRYDARSLSNANAIPEIIRSNEGMIFGILEANDGSIWFGTLDGAYRYDGNVITDFRGIEAK